MEKKTYRLMAAVCLMAAGAATCPAQIPDGYYDSLKGKKGASLKTAVHEIVTKNVKMLQYGSGAGHTWEGFYTTDRNDDNSVTDRYSNDIRYFESKGAVVGGMNIEHSFPKSWWGGSKNNAYKDLFNLMPSESKINSSKSNYPMGVVKNVKTDNGCTKVGTGDNGYSLWEPADKWKGDFARGYMYMATAYQNLSWSGTSASYILESNDYPTLKEWAYTLYISWAKQDPVNELEVKRNNDVNDIQGNRNPFVDFPNLMEYIWGDSIDYAFDPATTMTTSDYTSGGNPPAEPSEDTIYDANFTLGTGSCTTATATAPEGFEVWKQSDKYGWVGTGYDSATKQRHDTDATLTTPEIDLGGYESATLKFNHALNFLTEAEKMLAVEIVCDGTVSTLDGVTWPKGSDWTFIDTAPISLDEFAGKKIRIAFRYTSTTTTAGTWEIKKVNVSGKKASAGIGQPESDSSTLDLSRPHKAYSADGKEINSAEGKGIMIVIQDGKSYKIMK